MKRTEMRKGIGFAGKLQTLARQTEYLVELQKVIEGKYQCRATHRETVLVREKAGQTETVWTGYVEIFDLKGHKKAKVCYAWQPIDTRGIQTFTVLANTVIDSPHRAVQAAIFVGAQKPMRKGPADLDILKKQIEAGQKALYQAEVNIEDLDSIIHASQEAREQRRKSEG
jgi:hypothetical protein